MPSLNVASSCRSSARHAFHAFLFWRSFEYATFVRSRSRRRRSFSMAWSSISCNEVLVSSAICARLRCVVRLMRIVDGIQICIRWCMQNCQRTRKRSERLKRSCSHRPVACPAWRSSLSQRGTAPPAFAKLRHGRQGRGYSDRSSSRLLFQTRTAQQGRGYSLLELTHDRCTRFRLGKANRLRMQQARL